MGTLLPLPTLQTFLTSLHSKATSTNISIYQDSASDGSTHGTPSFLPLWLLLCTSQLTLLHYMFPQRKDICHRVLFTHSFIRHILLGTYNVPGTQSGTKDTWWRQMPVTELMIWLWRVTMDRLWTSQRLWEEKRKRGTSPWQWSEKAPPKNNTSWDLKNE